MNCSKCNSTNYVKAGFVKGRQRYKCKDCFRHYSVLQKSTASSKETKRMALQLYLEGLGFNSIGRVLGVSHVSVQNWIRDFGKSAESLKSSHKIEVMEIDEMHTYIGNKKTTVGYGLLLIEMGKDMSSSFWVIGAERHLRDSGKSSARK